MYNVKWYSIRVKRNEISMKTTCALYFKISYVVCTLLNRWQCWVLLNQAASLPRPSSKFVVIKWRHLPHLFLKKESNLKGCDKEGRKSLSHFFSFSEDLQLNPFSKKAGNSVHMRKKLQLYPQSRWQKKAFGCRLCWKPYCSRQSHLF